MKKVLTLMSVMVLIFACSIGLAACGETAKFTVIFDVNTTDAVSNAPLALVDVEKDATIAMPTGTAREDYFLVGWFKEKACTTQWKFDTDKVTENITLYAKWQEITQTTEVVTVTGVADSTGFEWDAPATMPEGYDGYIVKIQFISGSDEGAVYLETDETSVEWADIDWASLGVDEDYSGLAYVWISLKPISGAYLPNYVTAGHASVTITLE